MCNNKIISKLCIISMVMTVVVGERCFDSLSKDGCN